MDDNTAKVVIEVIGLISSILTPIVVYVLSHKQNKKMDKLETKLDDNHKLSNGNMDKLIKSTADLATLTEKNKHES